MAQKVIKRRRAKKSTQVPQRGLESKVALVEKLSARAEPLAAFGAGDTVKVHVRIKEGEKERVQIFEGLVIAQANRRSSRSFTVRKMSHGVGVERIFLESSPKVAKVERVQEGRVRRAKLYYVRELQGRAAKIERELETTQPTAAVDATKPSSK